MSEINDQILTNFHCCPEWHLAKLKSPTGALIYPFAHRLSRRSHKFSCSSETVGEFFGRDRKTVLRAFGELCKVGFFELIEKGRFDVNVYRVLSHTEWAAKNPGKCAQKVQYPWTGEGDKLGQRLYAASGTRVKFRSYQVAAFRNTGLDEETIVSLFETFRSGIGQDLKPKNVGYRFLEFLRNQ